MVDGLTGSIGMLAGLGATPEEGEVEERKDCDGVLRWCIKQWRYEFLSVGVTTHVVITSVAW